MLKINIFTQLVIFFMFAIVLNILNFKVLILVALVLLVIIALIHNHQFYRLFKRLKWFYLVMFAIFAFNTPGEHLSGWTFSFSPTYEGFRAGLTQLLRITVMLEALSILLASNNRQKLISGFYFILSPLRWLGVDVERFAARLWLTLHYVETQQPLPKGTNLLNSLNKSLTEVFKEETHENVTIRIEEPIFTGLDYVLIVLSFLLLGQVLLKAFS
ncbi:MAG: CbiQ family ECF transporter T component [Methylophilaceae bacterium]